MKPTYTGRFAPSPTGPLHLGSLVTALASYLDARAHGGRWLVRMEDLDPPREEAGAADAILRCLETHHLYWDDTVLYQSRRAEAYRSALESLQQRSLCYRCVCSRQELQGEAIYQGHCRSRQHVPGTPAAIRLDMRAALAVLQQDPLLRFNDLLQGPQQQDLQQEAGDFVIHRKDGLFAYQLAVVVDDLYQNITHVIRGADLLDSTARQILLFKLLAQGTGLNPSPFPPAFGHVPLVVNAQGQKLSKQNLAPALVPEQASDNLYQALLFLGTFLRQAPPPALKSESPATLLQWGREHWQRPAVEVAFTRG